MTLILSCCVYIPNVLAAAAQRSDTLDIRKTIIHFTITDFVSKNISAKTSILVKSLMNNVNEINLDLQGLTVDSVMMNNLPVTFTAVSPLLQLIPNSPLNQNDSVWIDIYYHGIPVADPTWGGFSYVNNYAFQIGVGFTSQPHSVGRMWHPCFDNMVERSEYEFFITTTDDKMATCNGLLIDSIDNANGTKTWHWKLNETIPSYLACVSVSNYVLVKSVLSGNNGNIDSWIACEAADTNKVNGSFAHLQDAFQTYESHFGNYLFPRVGYSLVPFNGGAMEHATNISIGKVFIDGTLAHETLIAHELSHHWFGDAVTCSTVGDMWLNEGFASYCEALHLEAEYGYEAYRDDIRAKHYDALFSAHVDDNGYRSIANMDSLHTYGTTVYIKGADAIHSMRTYLGDSLFFTGLKNFIAAYQFKSASSADLRNFLSTATQKDMTPFFDHWIFAPGFTNFCIDSIHQNSNGNNYDVSVFLRQRKHKSIDYYSKVPLEIGFYDAQWVKHIYTLEFNGRCMEFKVNLPFNPVMIIIDPDEKISDAVTENELVIKNTGNTVFNYAKCLLLVKGLVNPSDSSYIRIAHHWVMPDRFKNQANANGYVLNDLRYWRVDGLNLNNLQGLIRFDYSGQPNNNRMDTSWIKNTEDSIRLFYRKDATEEWQFANDSLSAGSLLDKFGYVFSKEIKAGEYCFGIKRSNYTDPLQTDAPSGGCSVVLETAHVSNASVPPHLYPNPCYDVLIYQDPNLPIHEPYSIHDMTGKTIASGKLDKVFNNHEFHIPVRQIESGLYILNIRGLSFKFYKW